MAFTDWDTTAANNTSVGGVSIAEGMDPSDVNDAMRAMMAELKAGVLSLSGGTMTGGLTMGADISMGQNDIWSVGAIGWNVTGDTSGDYMTWPSGTGLVGYENGTIAWVLGTGTQVTRFTTAYSQTTANTANVHVTSTGALLRSTSSGESKVNRIPVRGIPDVAQKMKSVTPFSFESTHTHDNGRRFIGFDAAEVAAAYPEAGVYDDDGNPINYDVRALVAILWQENDDRQAEIADLRARVEAMESA